MNADAHSHRLVLTSDFPISKPHRYDHVEYGDQRMRWPHVGPFKEARRRRRVRLIVQRHDRESINAGHRANAATTDHQRWNAIAEQHAGAAWR